MDHKRCSKGMMVPCYPTFTALVLVVAHESFLATPVMSAFGVPLLGFQENSGSDFHPCLSISMIVFVAHLRVAQ
jgi:hypothetical protein